METEFKTDVDLLEPIDSTAGEAVASEPTEQPSGDAAASAPTAAPRARRRRLPLALAALAVGCMIAVAVWLYARPTQPAAMAVALPPAVEQTAHAEMDAGMPDAAGNFAPPGDSRGLADKLKEVDELRQLLQSKRHEILKIKEDYRYGILELEDEVRRLLKHGRIDSLALARKNSEIELLLQNIQRRQMHSETLDRSMQWLDAASEELLYMKRRASIDILAAPLAEGIDLQRLLSELDQALQKSRPTPGRLSIDPKATAAPPLEAIGKRLIEQARLMAVSPNDDRNQEIVAEVCSGNVMRAGELSKLSLRGARCLAESTAKQLLLNRLTELSPLAAQKLAEWPGEWLCLNGLARLDADVAARLFAWQGSWISLNGLKELSPEAGKQAAAWNGRQLELMGLQQPVGLDHLLKWEAAGGRLFMPETIRRTTDRAAGHATGNANS